MNNRNVAFKNNTNILSIVLKILFGFLVPYVLINGIIFFLFIQTPSINVIDNESTEYEDNKIKFTVTCILPLLDVKVFLNQNEIIYSKYGNTYIIDVSENGTYQIKVTALNHSMASSTFELESLDNTPPTIDIENAIVTGNTLTLSIFDNQSGINYDKLYATLKDGSTITPSYVESSSGTIQFKVSNSDKIIIHVEDNIGNHSDASFTFS